MPVNETTVLNESTTLLVHPNLEARFNAKVVECKVVNGPNSTHVQSTFMHVGCK